jgi:hypothetical protein
MVDCTSVSYCKEVNKGIMEAVRLEVDSSFTRLEIIQLTDFEDFFSEVDIQNAYEENWNRDKEFYKPFYESVYHDILKGK